MRLTTATSLIALVAAAATPAASAQDAEPQAGSGGGLETITITTQRRETGLQDAAVAVSAVTGDDLEASNIASYEDLAGSISSLSFTALSVFDHEYNIRGVTNTRLDAPTSDQSIGIFVDEVYVGRSGLLNTNFFDIERVEVVRGPQGVLLGRNVVGGAISIITAAPEFEPGGSVKVGYGNFNAISAEGHVTGGLGEGIAGRLSFNAIDRGGYNKDVLNNRELDDLQSVQLRGQLLFEPTGANTSARLIADFMDDKSNGAHAVAVANPTGPAGPRPWSTSRAALAALAPNGLDVRESVPGAPTFKGDAAPTPQKGERTAFGLTLQVDHALTDTIELNSVTGYRSGEGSNYYSQTGFEPGFGFPITSATAFDSFVYEDEDITQFSQELRLLSNLDNSMFDWIVGGYYQKDDVEKFDRFWAANVAGIPVLSGESHWDNKGESLSYGVFGQLGAQLTEQIRVVGGVRWNRDEKSGTVIGTAVETGDPFNPTDPVALTPIASTFMEGESFTGLYDESWEEVTPQVTIEYAARDNAFLYLTWSKGYKGGGFEDTPANAAAAAFAYDPETVTNVEIGGKFDFADNRARLNLAAFMMDYTNLQVTQTDAGCLCNITDNAADAEIMGLEAEFLFAATDDLLLWASGTVLETEYIDFVDSVGRDNSGNFLQRTPDYQINVGAELTTDLMDMEDALKFRINYSQQGEMYWLPDNLTTEEGYGLLDGRITLSPPDAEWALSIWGRNLTDELYRVNVIPFFGDEVSRLGAPQTYGVELSTQF